VIILAIRGLQCNDFGAYTWSWIACCVLSERGCDLESKECQSGSFPHNIRRDAELVYYVVQRKDCKMQRKEQCKCECRERVTVNDVETSDYSWKPEHQGKDGEDGSQAPRLGSHRGHKIKMSEFGRRMYPLPVSRPARRHMSANERSPILLVRGLSPRLVGDAGNRHRMTLAQGLG
jgi:hypothetical protein